MRSKAEMTPYDELAELEAIVADHNPGHPRNVVSAGVDPLTASREALHETEPATPKKAETVTSYVIPADAPELTTPTYSLTDETAAATRRAMLKGSRRASSRQMSLPAVNLNRAEAKSGESFTEFATTPHQDEIKAPEPLLTPDPEHIKMFVESGLGQFVTEKSGHNPNPDETVTSARKFEAGEIVARKTKATARNKNGTRRLYQADENGKLRPISQDKVLELNGFGPNVDVAPAAETEPPTTDTPSAAPTVEADPGAESRRRQVGRVALKVGKASLRGLGRVDDAAIAYVGNKLNVPERADQLNNWGLATETKLKEGFKTRVQPAVNAKNSAVELFGEVKADGIEAVNGFKERYARAKKGFDRARAFIADAKIGERAGTLTDQATDFGLKLDKIISEKAHEVVTKRKRTAAVALGMVAVATFTLGFGGESKQADVKAAAAYTQEDTPRTLGQTNIDPTIVFKAFDSQENKLPSVANAPEITAQRTSEATPAKTTIAKPEITKPEVKPEALTVKAGDRVWNVLENAGIPPAEIMQRLDDAAKASGLNYEWHGSGENRWLEVDGKSDAKSIVNSLDKFIQR